MKRTIRYRINAAFLLYIAKKCKGDANGIYLELRQETKKAIQRARTYESNPSKKAKEIMHARRCALTLHNTERYFRQFGLNEIDELRDEATSQLEEMSKEID
jgi:hypothetical protein